MKSMLQEQVCSPIRNIVALTFIITVCSGITHFPFNCSNYTFHESSTKGRDWKTSRELCQNSTEGDLVSIEEEKELIFLKKIIKDLKIIKYYIGLQKDRGEWKWLSNGNSVPALKGKHPWSPGEPNGASGTNCATIYGTYKRHLEGLFDDLPCSDRDEYAGYICERAVSCTKEGKAELTTVYKDTKRPSTTQSSPVRFTIQSEMTSTQPREPSSTKETEKFNLVRSITTSSWNSQSSAHSTAEIDSTTPGLSWTKRTQTTKQVRSTTAKSWKGEPDAQSTSEIDSIEPATTNLERADESSVLITIIVSVLAFVILGIGIALWYFLVYRPRKNGSKSKIQEDHRQNNSTQLRRHGSLSPAEEEMGDLESLPEVQRQDTCIDIEEGDRGSFLSMPQSSAKRQEEAFFHKQSSVDSSNAPLNNSATTKASKKNNTSKAFIKKDTPEQHHVYAIVHINPKQDKAAFHLNPVGLSSSGLVKELTRNEEAIVEKPGHDQCNDCVYAIVDKTKKKRQPPKKPAPYHDLLYADLSHSPKKSDNGRIQQESITTVYADIDHIKSSAMSDSRLQQENGVKLSE